MGLQTPINSNIQAAQFFTKTNAAHSVYINTKRTSLLTALSGANSGGLELMGKGHPDAYKVKKGSGLIYFTDEKHEFDIWNTSGAPTPSGTYAAQIAPTSPSFDPMEMQSVEVPVAKFSKQLRIPKSFYDTLQKGGDINKTRDWLEKKARNEAHVLAMDWNLKLYGNVDQTENTVGGLPFAISDTNTYQGIDRSNAANTLFRGNVIPTGAAVDLETHLLRDIALIKNNGGDPDLLVAGSPVWAALSEQIEGRMTYNEVVGSKYDHLGKDKQFYRGVCILNDVDCPGGEYYLLDTEFVHLLKTPGYVMDGTGWQREQATVASYLAHMDCAILLFVNNPRMQVRRTTLS